MPGPAWVLNPRKTCAPPSSSPIKSTPNSWPALYPAPFLCTVFRHTAATITSIIGLLFVIPILAHLLPSSWYNDIARWLPDSAGGAITATVAPQDSHLFSPWSQFTVFAVYTAILLIVGGILFRRRDA